MSQQNQPQSNSGCTSLALLFIGVLLSLLAAMPFIFLSSVGELVDDTLQVADEIAEDFIASGGLGTSIAFVNSVTTPISPSTPEPQIVRVVITATLSPEQAVQATKEVARATHEYADEQCKSMKGNGQFSGDEDGEQQCFENMVGCEAHKEYVYERGRDGYKYYFWDCIVVVK